MEGKTRCNALAAFGTNIHAPSQPAYIQHSLEEFRHASPSSQLRLLLPPGRKTDGWPHRFHPAPRLSGLIRTRSQEVELFCAHDPVEYELLTGHSQRVPAGAAAANAGIRAGKHWQPQFPKP